VVAQWSAALLHSIALYQALLDGSERLALGAALLMLRLNDARSSATHDELFDLMIDIADGPGDVRRSPAGYASSSSRRRRLTRRRAGPLRST
jgi:prophage maintenance system killer protein